jgi:hypothetical protein
MSESAPTPPADLPSDIVDELEGCSPELLHQVARYAEELADYRQDESSHQERDGEEIEVRPDDLPDDVPSKASITIKEINENRYYYWQRREGDRTKSKYKEPVNSDD